MRSLFILLLLICPVAAAQDASLAILPEQIELVGPQARQQLLAQAATGSAEADWTRKVEWTSRNPAIAQVTPDGVVTPVADGSTEIVATAQGKQASQKVTVRQAAVNAPWSFRNHVLPILTKKGCNQGACHGALAGKNGLKLTLRGYDPETDHYVLTREAGARRVSLADPEGSLMLLKPAMKVGHGGGLLLPTDSYEYKILAEWIAQGAPGPEKGEAEVTGLEVYPRSAVLQPEATQRLIVRAKYSDGRVADVTRWAKFNSTDAGVASVEDNGLVKMVGYGDAAITVWYANKVLYARLAVPHPNQVTQSDYSPLQQRNYIDKFVEEKLRLLKLTPSRRTTDEEFVRRVFLDTVGVLPSAEEVEEFLASQDADKREQLIDRLLERPEFTDYWAYKWSDLLLVSSRKLGKPAMWDFYNWIHASVEQNKPWDQFALDIFTASGSTRRNGALNYFVLHKDPIDLAENVTQAFLGQRLTCARCHNHPMEKWTQTQYYQFANLFTRVGIKDGTQPGESIVFAKATGDINHPRLLRPLPPAPLDGHDLSLDAADDRREHFADWLTSPENPYFARNIVNRVWANFLGRGLTDPEDDLRATNPASNEALFDALTSDFVKSGFDIKHLIRTILTSATYQLSSEPSRTNQHDDKYYSKYIVRRLPAEVILDAMSQVTGAPTQFDGYALGTRAMELPDVRVKNQFLDVFGRPPRVICDVGERSQEPSIAQALHVINGDTLNDKLRAPNSNPGLFLKLGLSDARIVDQIYLSAFSRYPREQDKAEIIARLRQARTTGGTPEAREQARREAIEDLMWALLSSKEFLFNY